MFADREHRAIHVERSRNHVVNHRTTRLPQHAIHRREQIGQRCRERTLVFIATFDGNRNVGSREPVAPIVTEPLEHVHYLAHLLVLEQAPHQLRAGVFPPSIPSGRGNSICALIRSSRAAISRYSAATSIPSPPMRARNWSATRAIGMS